MIDGQRLTARSMAAVLLLAGACVPPGIEAQSQSPSPAVATAAVANRIDPQLAPEPKLFAATARAKWDGALTLQGLWIAHPQAREARRVRITNLLTQTAVDGALFRRDNSLTGPAVLISSDLAQALGMAPGVETELSIVAVTLANAAASASPSVDTTGVTAQPIAPPTASGPATAEAVGAPGPASPAPVPRPASAKPVPVPDAATPKAEVPAKSAALDLSVPLAQGKTDAPAEAAAPAPAAAPVARPQPAPTPPPPPPAAPEAAAPVVAAKPAAPDAPAAAQAETAPATAAPSPAPAPSAPKAPSAALDLSVPLPPASTDAPDQAAKPQDEAPKPAAPVAAPAKPEPPKAAAPTGIADGRRYIQAGSFGVLENANTLVAKLKAAGLAAETRGGAAGALARVLVGPFDSREAREAAMASLRRLGLKDATPVKG